MSATGMSSLTAGAINPHDLVMMKRTRTPQEKKELSYAKDGRNTSAEGRRKAHTSITRRKVKANRALRHAEARALAAATEPDAYLFVARRGRRSWQKVPDAPLGEYVSLRLESRQIGEMNAGDKRSPTLNAGRKRARFRNFAVMGGFYRGQNKMLCRATAEARALAAAAGDAEAAVGARDAR